VKPLLLLLPWVLAGVTTVAMFGAYGRMLAERSRTIRAVQRETEAESASDRAIGRAVQALRSAVTDPDLTVSSRNRLEIAIHELEGSK
jgi:hypothetical protein